MNIDRKKLVTLISEASGLSEEDVDKQLTELIGRIEKSSENGKALEIKDFGMFYLDEESNLTFSPSEELETEVNFRYAGMEPIEIKRPLTSGESIPDEDDDVADDDIFGFGDFDSSPEPISTPDEPKVKVQEMKPDKKPVSKPAGIDKSKTSSGKTVTDKKVASGKGDQPELKVEKDPATALITTIVTVLIIIVGVIVLADAGYLDGLFTRGNGNEAQVADATMPDEEAMDMPAEPESLPGDTEGNSDAQTDSDVAGVESDVAGAGLASSDEAEPGAGGEGATPPPVVSAEPAEQPVSPAEVESDDSDEMGEADESIEQPAPPAPIASSEDNDSSFGLTGEMRMINSQFYTIIVHSFIDEADAREETETLESQGYRAMTVNAVLDELGQRWRVGIGQFGSIEQAQEAAGNLPQPYQENNFIGIIK